MRRISQRHVLFPLLFATASGLAYPATADGQPALIRAIRLPQADIALALIAAGANVQAHDAEGRSAMELARQQGHAAVVTRLREKAAQE